MHFSSTYLNHILKNIVSKMTKIIVFTIKWQWCFLFDCLQKLLWIKFIKAIPSFAGYILLFCDCGNIKITLDIRHLKEWRCTLLGIGNIYLHYYTLQVTKELIHRLLKIYYIYYTFIKTHILII